jgi:putative ABC transport system permease protein
VRRFVWRQLRARPSRTATLGAGILVAAVSFVLLTSAVSTSALEVRGTVAKNWKAAYDILVRPAGSYTPLERAQGLVADNYLSGIFGGITMNQWQEVLHVPGVVVAAPVANIGYVMLRTYVPIRMNPFTTKAPVQLYRVRGDWLADGGTSRYPSPDLYFYLTRQHRFELESREIREIVPRREDHLPVCSGFYANVGDLGSPFDLRGSQAIYCFSSLSGDVLKEGYGTQAPPFRPGDFGVLAPISFPVMLAGIDPAQEARLIGLDRSVVEGRFLSEGEEAQVRKTPSSRINVVPILASTKTFLDEELRTSVERLNAPPGTDVPAVLASREAKRFLNGLHGSVVGSNTTPVEPSYEALLDSISRPPAFFDILYDSYRTVSPVSYREAGADRLVPGVVRNPISVWESAFVRGFFSVPIENDDVQFRTLAVHVGSNAIRRGVADLPMLQVVGRFDPSRIQGFSRLARVPLESYLPPELQPADQASREVLGKKPILPTMNVGGYLQQPPLMFTTLQAAQLFKDPNRFGGADARAPISARRIRVAGVT